MEGSQCLGCSRRVCRPKDGLPEVGSSKKTTLLSPINAIASDNRRFCARNQANNHVKKGSDQSTKAGSAVHESNEQMQATCQTCPPERARDCMFVSMSS